MAQKVIKGATGNVVVKTGTTAKAAKLTTISLDMGQQIFDVTSFGDSTVYGDFETGGMRSLSGSASGFVIYDVAESSPFEYFEIDSIEITWAPGCTSNFSVIVSDLQMGLPRQGIGGLSFNWVKSDSADPAPTWAEGA